LKSRLGAPGKFGVVQGFRLPCRAAFMIYGKYMLGMDVKARRRVPFQRPMRGTI
jgi:hypothetical protein